MPSFVLKERWDSFDEKEKLTETEKMIISEVPVLVMPNSAWILTSPVSFFKRSVSSF